MNVDGIWRERFRIRADEMDRHGTLSPLALFNYLQEAAGRHAQSLGFGVNDLLKRNQTWMLSRFFIQIDEYPPYGEELTVHTWPCGIDRFFALRDFLFINKSEKVIARATSGWLYVDLSTRRILRLESLLAGCTVARRALDKNLQKLPAPLIQEVQKEFRVRLGDIDINQHTNSAAYLAWILETIPFSTQNIEMLCGLEVNYQAESLYDDEIISEAHVDDTTTGSWLHRVQKKATGEELARARTTWKTRGKK
jgi:medium-chain acyl-[acyl-carrier-protein] hydrolase